MEEGLKNIINKWEIHPLVASFKIAGTVQRITVNEAGRYSWRRYFTVGGEWVVSIDKHEVGADEIMREMADLITD